MRKSTLLLVLASIFQTATAQTSPDIVNININHAPNNGGLELGTGTQALGNGSIATGENSVAVGKNAVATGNNEDKETITKKLDENQSKLNEIFTAETNTNRLLDELQTIRKKEADVIEAGERVKQVLLSKQSAYNVWQEKLNLYNTTKDNAANFLNDAKAKINDLNSRLTGVSRLNSVDITSDNGLTDAAQQLKSVAEKGTTLNLSVDFYKDYVSSYYKALGDLRINENIKNNRSDASEFSDQQRGFLAENDTVKNAFRYLNNIKKDFKSGVTNSAFGGIDFYYGNAYTFQKNAFKGISYDLRYKDINSITSEESYNNAKVAVPEFKAAFATFFNETNDPFMTSDVRDAVLNTLNTKLDAWLKAYEVTYYQGQYEETRNTTWLDKKAVALNEYNDLLAEFYSLPDPVTLRNQAINDWYTDNVVAVREKNSITTQTLTSELEKALGINKREIAEKEAEIAKLKDISDQAKNTYDNTNPSELDIAMSQRYEEIMKQLKDKSEQLKSEQDRLQALRDNLTLHNLTNIGENAFALGTQALSTGQNSIAFGTNTVATNANAIALGHGSVSTGVSSTTIGTRSSVLGNNSGILGNTNNIYGDNSYSVGNNNTIGSPDTLHSMGMNTFILGSNVSAKSNNSVILGANSMDAGDNTVSVGSNTSPRKIVYIANGDIHSKSRDAINGSQIYDILQNAQDINVENWQTKLGISPKSDTTTPASVNFAEDVAKHFGGGSTVNTDGHISSPTYSIVNTTTSTPMATDYSNVGDALAALDSNTQALHSALNKKADKKDIDNINSALNQKANSGLDNITDEGKNVIKRIVNSTVDVIDGKNTTVSTQVENGKTSYMVNVADDAIKNVVKIDLKSKADKNAGNLESSDVRQWQKTLGTGKNAAGDSGLITGDTLSTALSTKVDNAEMKQLKADVNNVANDIAYHLGGGAIVNSGRMTNPEYSIKDVNTDKINVYNNVGSALSALDSNTQMLSARINTMNSDIQNLRKDIADTRKESFAGTASAMAVAGLGQSVMPGKTSVSMSTSHYRGKTGYAIGVSRLSSNGKFLLKGAFSANNLGHYGGVISTTYTFD